MSYKTGFFRLKNQSPFLIIISGLMVFLSVLCLAIVLSLNGAVRDWSREWQNNATIQIIPSFSGGQSLSDREEQLKQIFKDHKKIIKKIELVSNEKKQSLISPWVSVSSSLNNYMPVMYNVEFKDKANQSVFKSKIESMENTKFMTHQKWHNEMNELGVRIILVALFLFACVFSVAMIAVIYTCKASMEINKREIEIFDIVGAYDKFIANQFAKMVLFQTLIGGIIGFLGGILILGTMISVVSRQQIGLTGMIRAESWFVGVLFLVPIFISYASVKIAKKTVLKKLQEMDNV